MANYTKEAWDEFLDNPGNFASCLGYITMWRAKGFHGVNMLGHAILDDAGRPGQVDANLWMVLQEVFGPESNPIHPD